MMQLREFARHQNDFNQLDTRIVAISVDDVEHNHTVWEKVTQKQFPVLSDSGGFQKYVKDETAKWTRTIRAANIRAD